MDILRQSKLSSSEWESIEIPIPESEMKIVKMIYNGYGKDNINGIVNYSLNMIRFTKLQPNAEIHAFLYEKYFHPIISDNVKSIQSVWKPFSTFSYDSKKIKNLKKADSIRIDNVNILIQRNHSNIYEFDCMTMCNTILEKYQKKQTFECELYTMVEWRKAIIEHTNPHVMNITDLVIEFGKSQISISDIVLKSFSIIEKNPILYKYENLSLFPHQKELFTICEQSHKDTVKNIFIPKPKLILYTAPTGTGKTLSPIGLSKEYKIIFVCVARHVGLALAKSAISIHKRVAFAFGCDTISDIKLHYFSAVDYTRDRKSGGIWKVDHSNGEKVEIMISDVHSYLHAMRYMMAFNQDTSTILTYWDEPTMTLDYEYHPLHETIKKNWKENEIYNMVLSCATLPKEGEIQDCIQDFRIHFNEQFIDKYTETDTENHGIPTVNVHTITSYDCRKSIPIVNQNGYCFMPHIHCETLKELHSYSSYCNDNKTLLRYFDLEEIIQFIQYIHEHHIITNDRYHMNHWFESINTITMNNLKLYYLDLLRNLTEETWFSCRRYLQLHQHKKYNTVAAVSMDGKPLQRVQSVQNSSTMSSLSTTTSTLLSSASASASTPTTSIGANNITRINSDSQIQELKKQDTTSLSGVLLTTKDAYTLTDGPTIYLADNILNMAKFYVKESKIPDLLMKQLIDGIVKNEKIIEKIQELELSLKEQLQCKDNNDKHDDSSKKGSKNSKPVFKEKDSSNSKTVEILENQIENLRSQLFHMSLNPHYIPNSEEHQEKWTSSKHPQAFRSSLTENDVKSIMELEISLQYKVLVLMGVGVLIQQEKKEYEEIVKQLADDQKLFLILTSSDYIYGTNYQFCHGFIGKDLQNMTPQKTLQAMGRVGRNKHQQNYTIRFRDDNMIHNLFKAPKHNREAINMNLLFSHD
jgi:hypothetical protein